VKPNRITGSALARYVQCEASAFLEQDEQPYSEAARQGHRIHTPLEYWSLGARVEDIVARSHPDVRAQIPSLLEGAQRAEVEPLPGLPVAEVTFAFNPLTGKARILGAGLNRDYSGFNEGEWGGTADVIGLHDGGPAVLDWKSGKWIKPPRELWQMRFLAVCLQGVLGAPSGVFLAIHSTRSAKTNWQMAEPEDIAKWRQTLMNVGAAHAEVMAGREPAPTLGSECRFCASKNHCPAWIGNAP